ncbi:hypothetical protein E4634_19725 [Mangrovimicrobium sediminis]|uniref:Peptidase M15A C-terminal domain-containing protein n=1 Tax=Mangrovimicrobium sediminis TaxID=2562682 RepID=A0A4Z0LVC5_9GAMM|nr:D-Ala-D-Ala carboxypeptidase family metallohydrolase [Haliea sp. SAOS-164]TGD71078.1 hypothetical protein E4634_19725 [Haliea sp. SAOS-164]
MKPSFRWLAFALLGLCCARSIVAATLTQPVMLNGQVIPYTEFAVFVLPGTALSVGFIDATGGAELRFGGELLAAGSDGVVAPETPGNTTLEIRNRATGETCHIEVFSLVPASRVGSDQHLNGYQIGAYPREPLRGLATYLPPKGFVEVTAANRDTRISPHFTLGEFVAKQGYADPSYVVLRSELLLKLENILGKLKSAGHPVDDFVIMSGYRTPYYNRAIGNVPYSRHVYGGAADVFVDQNPKDGVMDDLNGDGKIDREDANWLADFINRMAQRGDFGPRIGGLGVYGATNAHGPFVHIDVRGTKARW